MQNSKTIEVPEFPDKTKESLELSDESWVIKSFRHEVQVLMLFSKLTSQQKFWWIITYRSQDIRIWNFTPILKKKFSFDSLHISDDIAFSFVCMNQGGLLEGSFCRVIFWVFLGVIFGDHFWGSFLGSFLGVMCCVAKVLSRNLIVFAWNTCVGGYHLLPSWLLSSQVCSPAQCIGYIPVDVPKK